MGTEKMSKSLGNVTLVHDLLKEWDGEVIRLALLKAHYRSELQWSEDLLKDSKAQLDRWYRVLLAYPPKSNLSKDEITWLNTKTNYVRKLLDDLTTPKFISTFSSTFLNVINSRGREPLPGDLYIPEYQNADLNVLTCAFQANANLLGLLQKDPDEWFTAGITNAQRALGKEYDKVRASAMAAKAAQDKAAMGAAFARSDEIRNQLKSQGIVIETGPDGSELRKA